MPATVMNRWIVVVGGILIQLCLGAIYAWSAFTKKLEAAPFDFSKTETQIIFAVGLASFAFFMALIAGKWQAKVGPRIVAITGGLIMGLGYILASFAPNDHSAFWWILIGVGLLGGAGIGFAYVCPIAALVKWFPDKKGLITGLAVAGFGFGALIWVKLTGGFTFGPVKLTGDWAGLYGMGWSVQEIFRLYGVLFAVFVGVGAFVMVNPPQGWLPTGWTPPPASQASSGSANYRMGQMVRTPQFWGLFMTFVFGATAGLMVIGIIKLYGTDAYIAKDATVTRILETYPAADVTQVPDGLLQEFGKTKNADGEVTWDPAEARTEYAELINDCREGAGTAAGSAAVQTLYEKHNLTQAGAIVAKVVSFDEARWSGDAAAQAQVLAELALLDILVSAPDSDAGPVTETDEDGTTRELPSPRSTWKRVAPDHEDLAAARLADVTSTDVPQLMSQEHYRSVFPVIGAIGEITLTAMGLFYALFNGLGRILWGLVSDFTGRKPAIILMCLAQGIMMIAFYFIGGSQWGLYIGAAIIGFNFGGNFALFPAATADFFGNKNVGSNYPLVFLAYGVGGIVGPILGGRMGDMAAWQFAFIPAGIACLLGAVVMIAMKPPKALAAAEAA
jgi:MFS family permease